MSDFVLCLDRSFEPARASEALRDRPGLEERPIDTHTFPWGALVVQHAANPGLVPYAAGGTVTASAGRPIFADGTTPAAGRDGVLRTIAERWSTVGAAALAEALSGMYVLVRADDDGAELLTDQMGFRPLYVARDRAGAVAALGTHVEAVALAAGREDDLDWVSLGELVLDQRMSFPHTSRRGVRELDSCARIRLRHEPGGAWSLESETLWQPEERLDERPAERLSEELEAILRRAGRDVTRGAERVAFTLSGGWDSRGVLVSLPHDPPPTALTFATRENRETEIATAVARRAGVPHRLVRRDPDFFARMVPESVRLLGIELRANAHGLCLLASGIHREFDLIVGGQLCDTLLKDHFVPRAEKERFRPRALRERVSVLLRSTGVLPPHEDEDPWGDQRRALEACLRPEIVEAVRARQRERLEVVRAVRPTTAEEWREFWPASRQNDSGHNLGNSRLYASDGLYMHRAVVDFAAGLPPGIRYDGALAKRTFRRMYGPLAEIPIANTGVPPKAGDARERRVLRKRRRAGRLQAFQTLPPSEHPWSDVQTSWTDWVVLQKASPAWAALRARLSGSPGVERLGALVRGSPAPLVEAYRPEIGQGANLVLVQLALALDAGGALALGGRGSAP